MTMGSKTREIPESLLDKKWDKKTRVVAFCPSTIQDLDIDEFSYFEEDI